MVVQECHERVFSVDEGVKQEPMGLQVIRGNNMYIHTTSQQTNSSTPLTHRHTRLCFPFASLPRVLIGEVDKKADDALDFDTIHGEPLKSLQY